MMFVTQSQKDYIDAATGTESKREFMESETANRFSALGADPEIAYDEDLPPPVDGDEDTDLEDAFMDPGNEDGKVFNFLSQIRYDYSTGTGQFEKRGQERLEKNRELIPAAKESMQSSMEEAANRSPQDIAAYGLDDTGNAIYNFTKTGIDFVRTDLEPPEVGMAQAGLMEMYDRLPNGTWKGTKRFARSVFTDPVNFVGGVANFKLVRQLLSKGGTKAVRDHIMERAAKAAGYTIIGAEGSAYAAMAEYMNQKLSHDPEQGEWQPDWPQIFAMGGFGAVAAAGGTAAIRAVPDAVRAGRDIVRDRVAPVVRDLFDAPAQAGTTLTSGVGPVPRTAANEATDPAPIFFSAVSKAVDALPMEKGSAQQMRSMIAKSEGVKPEEMAWTGLDDFLKGKKSVTKAEVRDYVQANQVQLEEVAYPTRGTVDEFQNSIKDLVAKYKANGGTYVDVDIDDLENPESITFGNKFGNTGDLDDVLEGITPEGRDAAEDILDAFDDFQRELEVTGDRTKFSEYTLPGGENYREVLLTLPETRGTTISDAEKARLEELTDKRIADSLDGLTDAEQIEYITLVGKREDRGQFRSPHFDEPNVLAHMRLNDRTGPNGEKILFIEEIQSDWHQKGRKKGYKVPVPTMDKPTQARFDKFKKYRSLYYDARMGKSEAITGGDPGLTKEYEALEKDFEQYFGNVRQVPDAPLKKTWHEMSLRRIARMAAEEGYDAIGWTPGKMQAERYDLSKQISEIHLSGTNFKAFGLNGEEVIARTGVTPDDLPELIGKEAADRLMSEKPKNGLRSLTGEQLEVGGEGMKGFYDKILKNYAAKWGKKFGAKVGVTEIDALDPEEFTVGAEVFTLPVTKKMRDSVLKKGVPLFGAAGTVGVAGGAATSDTSERPDT